MRRELKLFRVKNNLSQEAMASILDVSRQWYIRIEKGVADPNINMLEKFSKIFGVDDVLELFKKE